MTFAAPLPVWVVALVVAGAAALAWRTTRGLASAHGRRLALTALRVAVVVALLVVFMRPVRVLSEPPDGRVPVAVLVDASPSMDLEGASGASRFDEALAVVGKRVVPSLEAAFSPEVWTFGARLDRLPAAGAGAPVRSSRSDLGAALAALAEQYASRPLAGVVVVSDGAVAPPPETALAAWPTPVLALGTGLSTIARDDEVVSVSLGETHISETAVDLTATVRRRGVMQEPLEVRLFENGRAVDLQTLDLASGELARVVFRVLPPPEAATRYTVSVAERPGELTPRNNARSVLASPAGRVRKVLMVEGAPGFEHSFLKRSWDRDRAVLLDSVVRKGQNDQGRDTWYVQAAGDRAGALAAGFPIQREALFGYDALVLANFEAASLSRDQLAMLDSFVTSRGGGLLVVGARSFEPRAVAGTPLARLLPLDVAARTATEASSGAGRGAAVDLTVDGRAHPILRVAANEADTAAEWARSPRLAGGTSVGGLRPGASVLALMASPTGMRPLVSTQRAGAGRVVAFTGEAAFRWKMMRPSDDRLYDAFWRQTLRWVAAPAPAPVAVTTAPEAHGRLEGSVVVRNARFEPVPDATVTVELVPAEGEPLTLTPPASDPSAGLHVFSVPWDAEGPVRVEVSATREGVDLGRDEAWVLSVASGDEFADPRQHPEVLARVASATGGALVEADDVGTIAARLADVTRARRHLAERDLWHAWWVWALVLALLSGEWALRRQWGLR